MADRSPVSSDTDGDGLDDIFDTNNFAIVSDWGINGIGTNAPLQNRDGTTPRDWRDTDDDNDGIPTVAEDVNANGNYADDDVDGDMIPNYLDSNPIADRDDDGLSDGDEAIAGSDPCDSDTDNDGLIDSEEVVPGADHWITDPLDADSDDDGLSDGQELTLGTTPVNFDTDGDGLSDGLEFGVTAGIGTGASDCSALPIRGSDPLVLVTDSDPTSTSNPLDGDSDNDGVIDGDEDQNGNGAVDGDETNPGIGLSACSSASLSEHKLRLDGAAGRLAGDIEAALQLRRAQTDVCGRLSRSRERTIRADSQAAYTNLWSTVWGGYPAASFVCEPVPSTLCSSESTASATSQMTSRTNELNALFRSAIGSCSQKTRRGRSLSTRATREVATMRREIATIPASILFCRSDQ
ncbi:MAG: hypothetical protein IT290_04665 [Deltaproteobacteria bacterium]|nr:hypothetical protein [Deltaproteobacteria bacterium]